MAGSIRSLRSPALTDAEHALKDAREVGQAATLMYALSFTLWTNIFCGNYATAAAQAQELAALAEEKDAMFWKALGISTVRLT